MRLGACDLRVLSKTPVHVLSGGWHTVNVTQFRLVWAGPTVIFSTENGVDPLLHHINAFISAVVGYEYIEQWSDKSFQSSKNHMFCCSK